jgi:hypothetical protein
MQYVRDRLFSKRRKAKEKKNERALNLFHDDTYAQTAEYPYRKYALSKAVAGITPN